MEASKTKFQYVDEYVSTLPDDTRAVFEEVRKTIKEAASETEEVISYNIPATKLKGAFLVYFSAWKAHISLYPRTKALEEQLGDELKPYEDGKGTLKFMLNEPMPLDLISRIVKIKLKESEEKGKSKR